jgi:hypothetical protein
MAPIIPFLSDSQEQLTATVKAIAEAGARYLSPIVLHLRPGAREWFLGWLREAHPELVPRYAELYGRGSYARKDYQARIAGQVRELAERFGVGQGAAGRGGTGQRGTRSRAGGPAPSERALPPAQGPAASASHEQLTLLLSQVTASPTAWLPCLATGLLAFAVSSAAPLGGSPYGRAPATAPPLRSA